MSKDRDKKALNQQGIYTEMWKLARRTPEKGLRISERSISLPAGQDYGAAIIAQKIEKDGEPTIRRLSTLVSDPMGGSGIGQVERVGKDKTWRPSSLRDSVN